MSLHYSRHANVRMTALEGEGVVLHLDSRRYFTLNATGLALLEALAEPRTIEELVHVLTDRFEVSANDAAATARAFLDQCVTAGVVSATGGP
jgi:hypothetical protein